MYKSRKSLLLNIFTILIFALLFRFLYFQIFSGADLAKAASVQKLTSSVVEIERGRITDKNSIPFVNRTPKVSVVLQPLILKKKPEKVKQISEILGLKYYELKRDVETEEKPIVINVPLSKKNELEGLKGKGVSIINSLSRYGSDSVANHILGYLNGVDQVGEAGIEKHFDKILDYNSNKTVGLVTDAWKQPLEGLGYRLVNEENFKKELNVKLTLDYHIQKIVEEVLDNTLIENEKIKGAVVVEDVCTGDIAAIASKPDFDPNLVDKYLNSPQKELFNRAVASYNLGSIFKVIDVAEALEAKTDLDERYFCQGFIKIGDKEFKCESYSYGGHGSINLKDAFAKSCNAYFIQIGLKIGYKEIISMAQRFGLGSYTGINEQGVAESKGSLPDPNQSYTYGDVANLSIGQGQVMASPIQVADIVSTIANGGIKNKVNIVDSLVDKEGGIVEKIKVSDGKRIISKSTSDAIRKLMEEVVSTGTGTKASLEKYGGAGGKTGSAEAGIGPDGQNITHAWFAGYFPRKNPKYAITVFVEDGKRGGTAAAPIFESIAEEIMKKGY